MKKIIPLNIDPNFYIDKAIDKANNYDFIGSLEMLRHAQQFVEGRYTQEDYSVRLEVADALADLDLFNESTKEYLAVVAGGDFVEEAFYGIIKNYALLENPEVATNYLRLGTALGILVPEDSFDPEEIEYIQELVSSNTKKPFKLIKGDDNSHTLAVAKTLLSAYDIDFARQVLLTVPKNSPQHLEASNYLALIELSEGKGDRGLKICREILEQNPSDICALTTEIIGLDMEGRYEELNIKVAALDALDISDTKEVTKVALCFCQINNSVLAHKYLTRSLEVLPYDKELLLLHVITAANLGEYKSGKKSAVKLRAIYPDDTTVGFYARELEDSFTNKKDFALIPDLPKFKRVAYAKLLDKFVSKSETPDEFLKEVDKNDVLSEAVLYALQCDNDAISAQIGSYISFSSRGRPYIKELLVDPLFSLPAKKEILISYLKAKPQKEKTVALVVNHLLYFLKPTIPKEITRIEIKAAYWQVYGTICCMGLGVSNDTKKLTTWIKKINKALESLDDLDTNTIAALLANKANMHKIFDKPLHAVEIFAAKEMTFVEYEKLLGQF